MTKDEVADALSEIGTLLELQGENDFRTRAYHNAARAVTQLEGDIARLIEDGKLDGVRGIGEAIREKIFTLVTNGSLPYLIELRSSIPPGLIEMLRIPGLGPKKVRALHENLAIDSIDKLRAECESGTVAALKGFGAKTQAKILEGIRYLGSIGNRVLYSQAYPVAVALLERVKALPGVLDAELCGSLRRGRETVKDIDIVVSSEQAKSIMAAFVSFPEAIQVIGHGETKSSIVVEILDGTKSIRLGVDLRVVTEEQYPIAVLHFTGSKDHNIRLRQRANERGWSLNEYALTGDEGPIHCESEDAVYEMLGLKPIPPEMREDTGEIELAEADREAEMPALVVLSDLTGVFHNHTTASDGRASLQEMTLAAKSLGWEYFGVGDHSRSLTVANGLTPERVRQQWAEIDALNAQLEGIRILKGTECDILQDGSLDFDDELLAGFDYVVASVHSHFFLGEKLQTERVCKALAHPAVTMLGHATGRLLLRRDGYKINLDAVLEAAARYGKMIEINAQPDRLDLDWKYVKRAKALGIPLVINPDAHRPEDLEYVRYGVKVARRGWLTAEDVFNTRPLPAILEELKRRKESAR